MAGAPTGSVTGSLSDILDAEGYVQEEGVANGNVYDDVIATYQHEGVVNGNATAHDVPVVNGTTAIANDDTVAVGDGVRDTATPSSVSSQLVCAKCEEPMNMLEEIVNFNGEVWHPQCFL